MLRLALALSLLLPAIPVAAHAQDSIQDNIQDSALPIRQIAAPEEGASRHEALTPAAIGTIIETEGSGNLVLRSGVGGEEVAAINGMKVYPGDLVKTGEDAKALVLFLDNSRFTLGENAQLLLNDYVYDDRHPAMNMARYQIIQGPFLYAGGLMSQGAAPNNIRIQTSHGMVSLKDSTVWGGMLDGQYSVFIANGEAALETNRGRIRINGGQGTAIRSLNAIPERPAVWSTEKVNHAKENITLSNVDSVRDRIAAAEETHPDMLLRHKAYRNAARQDRIEQQTPRDSIKRLDNLPATVKQQETGISENRIDTADAAEEEAAKETTETTGPAPTPIADDPAAALSDPLPEVLPAESTDNTSNHTGADGDVEIEDAVEGEAGREEATAATTETVTEEAAATILAPDQGEDIPAPQAIEQSDVTPPSFPTPPPAIQTMPQDLPSDPAMRQEALEKLNMHNESTYNPL